MPLSAARVLLHPPKRYALSFDGEDDYVEVADDPSLRPSSITIEVMFYISDVTRTLHTLVSKRYNYYEFQLGYPSGGKYLIRGRWVTTDGTIRYTVSASRIIEPFTWYHAVYIYPDEKIFLNGSEIVVDYATGTTTFDPTYPLTIGATPDVADFAKGLIAFARIYNRALSAAEIQHNYLNPMSPITDGLVLWLKMEEGSGTTVHDYSGYGNDGVIHA